MAKIHMKDRHLERSRAGSRMLWVFSMLAAVGLIALAGWMLFQPVTPPALWLCTRVDAWRQSALDPAGSASRIALRMLFAALGFAARYSVQITMVLAAIALTLVGRGKRTEGDILSAGIDGEKNALELLRSLPDDYHVFANCTLEYNGGSSETDLIVVGPGGVSVVEVKNVKGCISGSCADRELEVVKTDQYGIDHEKTLYNPVKQVGTHVYRLAGLLRSTGHRAWVRGYVLFSNPESTVELKDDCETPVFDWRQRAQLLSGLQNDGRALLSAGTVKSIVNLLSAH